MIMHETSHYTLERDRFGNYLIRRRDGKSVYLQGDDAAIIEREMIAIEASDPFDVMFTAMCGEYDGVMS